MPQFFSHKSFLYILSSIFVCVHLTNVNGKPANAFKMLS